MLSPDAMVRGMVAVLPTAIGEKPLEPRLQSTFGVPWALAVALVTRICRVPTGKGDMMVLPMVKMSSTSLAFRTSTWATRSPTAEAT